MVAFLEKSTGSEGFHQVIDFLNQSHICYALTKKPDVYISFIKQFWRSAEATNDDNGEVQITATIDGHSKTITEASLRRHLKLDDHDGITSIPNSEIFEQLALMGYHTDSDNPKKTAWEQFSSNIATAVICLATNRRYNFSRLIFEHMVSNISSPHKFLMYPRFIQICLDMQRKQLQQHSRTYHVPSLSIKVFNNMKRPTKGYSGQEVALFPTMLNVSEPSTSPSRITSSPSHSPEPSIEHSPDHTTAAVSFPSPTQPTQPSPGAEQHIPTPHDSPLHAVHSHGSDEGSLKLIELTEFTLLRVKTLEDLSQAGKARKRARVVLEDDEMVEDDSYQKGGKISVRVIQDQGSSEKGNSKVSTAGATKSTAGISTTGATQDTASEVPIVSIAEVNISTADRIVYSRRSKETRKDKGKAIMSEHEPKKVTTKDIDWNDPSVQRYRDMKSKPKSEAQERKNMIIYLKNQGNYKMKDFKGMSYDQIRPIFKKVWNFNQKFLAKDSEEVQKEEVEPEQIEKDTSKKSIEKRKKSLSKKRTKKQKVELDDEKEDLKGYLDIVPREEVTVDVDCLSTKGDGSSKDYKILSEMLDDFDRQDVEDLYRLVNDRYSTSRPEGYDLMLWGDLHTLFEPDEESEIWKNQHEYNLISWSLCDFCGVHILLMQNGIAIHMLTEKKYPLSQQMLSRMLSKRLEVDHESTQAYEITSQEGRIVGNKSSSIVNTAKVKNRSRLGINSKDLRSLKIKKCKGISTDGLMHISKYCNQLRALCLEYDRYHIEAKNETWLHQLALNSTVLEMFQFKYTDLFDAEGLTLCLTLAEGLTLLAKNCSNSLISLKVGECYLSKLGDAFRYAVRLEHFSGENLDEESDLVGFRLPPNMRSLSIKDLPISQNSIVLPFLNHIRKLKLAFLDLRGCQCLFFKRCPNLEVLYTEDVCGDSGLKVIGKFYTKLRKLTHDGLVTHVGLVALAKGCTKLECLKVRLEDISNEAIEFVGTHLKNIRKFRIHLDKKDGTTYLPLDNGFRAMLMGCNNLERLDISLWHGGLTDLGLEYIGKHGCNLRFLSLTRIGKSDAGLVKLSKGCLKLRKLKLMDCPFSKQAVIVFNIPSLRYVWVKGGDYDRTVLTLTRPEFQL
ncbi:leucine-rich repeat, cysteine-containing subtype protein [Tanacetum coccineum]